MGVGLKLVVCDEFDMLAVVVTPLPTSPLV